LSLSVTRPFVCGCLTSPTMLRFHIPLIEPDVRISRIRLSDGLHRPTRRYTRQCTFRRPIQLLPRPPSRCIGVARPCGQSPGCWSLPQRTRSQVPSLHRHYPASTVLRTCPPPLGGPACPSRASGWERHRPTAEASRVACRFPLHTCHRHYPGGTGRALSLSARPAAAFPIGLPGRLPHCAFRGLLSVHSRYGLHAR
jgi:hypothetical protein